MPQPARHIIDAMATPSTPGSTSEPLEPSGEPVQLPISTFSTLKRRLGRHWRPKCGHITMARIYDESLRCDYCKSHGSFGWLYRCTQDREPLIFRAQKRGEKVTFDEVGDTFAEKMSLGKYGPDVRYERYRFLKEITAEQMQSYTPNQIATILGQRDNVHSAIARNGQALRAENEGEPLFPSEDPWVPKLADACQHTVCRTCSTNGIIKSWLSIDGVLNGDIPPTAATGFSFHSTQSRPVSDADVVKDIGYRAVPLPSGPQGSLTCLSSRSSTWSVIRPLDDFLQKIKTPSDLDDAPWLSWGDRAERQVIGCRDLDRTRESKVEVDPPEQYNSGHFSSNELRYEELPRAPPPSPILGAASHGGWNGPDSLGRGDDPTIYNSAYGGRRCVSKSTAPSSLLTTSTTTSRTWSSFLKTNQERVFSSCTPSCGKDHGVDSSLGSNPPAVAEHSQGEGEYDEGMSVFSNDEVFEVACQTALPLPSLEECHLLAQEMTAMEEAESEGGFFSEAPLEVPGGVALTEEGVESATADIALL